MSYASKYSRYASVAVCLAMLLLAGCNAQNNGSNAEATPTSGIAEPDGNSEETPPQGGEGNAGSGEIDPELVKRFYGVWTSLEDPDVTLEIGEEQILVGVTNGQLFSEARYVVNESNADEQSILIEADSEEISYDEQTEVVSYIGKLALKEEGKQLLFIHNYGKDEQESYWTR